MVPSGGFEPPA